MCPWAHLRRMQVLQRGSDRGIGRSLQGSERCPHAVVRLGCRAFEDYVLKFARPWSCTLPVIGEDGLMSWDNAFECPQGSDTVALTHASFAHDALMFTDVPTACSRCWARKAGTACASNSRAFPISAYGPRPTTRRSWRLSLVGAHHRPRRGRRVRAQSGITLLAPGETNERTFRLTLF